MVVTRCFTSKYLFQNIIFVCLALKIQIFRYIYIETCIDNAKAFNARYLTKFFFCSINKINNLEDFSQCKRLEELYIRQNDIRDINQVCHLQNLSNLKNLWLGENPCATVDG